MNKRTYPYIAWVLQPSFKPVEVTFIREVRSLGERYGDEAQGGKWYRDQDIHATKEAAIAHGWVLVEKAQADIDKRTENLRKKKASLTKAQGINTE